MMSSSTSLDLRTFVTSVFLLLLMLMLLVLPDLAVQSLSQSPQQPQQQPHRHKPGYQLRFEVTYNISGDRSPSFNPVVSNRCGEYHATTFLHNFIQLNPWLESHCNATRVRIDHKAVVYIHTTEVKVETTVNLNVSGQKSDGDNMTIIRCSEVLDNILQNVTSLDRRLRIIFQPNLNTSRMISSIDGTSDCGPATMHPARFQLKQRNWICDDSYVYSSEKWECYKDGSRHPTTQATSDRSTTSRQLLRTTSSSSSSPMHLTPSKHAGSPVSDGFQATVSPVTQPPEEATTEPEAPGPKYWGIEALRNFSRIHLTEGGRVFELPVRLWYNESAICQDDPTCEVSMVVSIDSDEEHPELMCRRTGEAIPQVAVSRHLQMSSLTPSSADETNFCGLRFPPNQTVVESTHVLLTAVIDQKYDGMQTRKLRLSLARHRTNALAIRELLLEMPILIEDRDKKATCQSINDPHITTFDGLEYNNFFEGEFILYRHRTLPFSVHAIYQKCHPNLPASCNCGVAVQSGDDVIVIDRCYRRHPTVPAIRSRLSSDDPTSTMKVQLFLNGNLTPGTKIYEDADGKKYFIYLPHGAYVKVITNGQLINLWIVPSPNDLYMTEGLCGVYDWNRSNDIHLRNGSAMEDLEETNTTTDGRPQPIQFIKDWSVDLETKESLFRGVGRASKPYEPGKYCICEDGTGSPPPLCGYATDINRCDIYQGRDVTTWLVKHALPPSPYPLSSRGKRRVSRDVNDNSVMTGFDAEEKPIVISKDFVPPSKYKWKNAWNEATAKDFCRKHIKDEYRIGQLCSQIPPVNFKQEITTCTEDIKITGNTSWADSARDSMKEQCLEEIQKNGSLPMDVYKQIFHGMCINDCSEHGQCHNGVCQCDDDYSSSDCSIHLRRPPYVNEMPRYGLCDVRYMNCSRVIVYGGDFIDSNNLTCHLQKCKMTDRSYEPLDVTVTVKAVFINFNAVECPIPSVHIYLIRISNNGQNTSEPLLFIPFDSVCNTCNVFNTTCLKRRNSCIIDGRCYGEGEKSPVDECLICKAYDDEYQWTTTPDESCDRAWWETFHLPDWAVALGAAIGGSLIGVITGFLLYRCCCRSKKATAENEVPIITNRAEPPDCSGFETDSFLHRSRGIPTFAGNPFSDLDAFEPDLQEPTSVFYNDGKGVENGVDSTTYF